MHPLGVQRRVGAKNIRTHSRAHRDDGVSGLDGRLLHPGRDAVPATELLCLPRSHRLEGVGGENVGYVVQHGRKMSCHPGVPRVRMSDRCRRRGVDHGEVGRQCRERGVGTGERGVGLRDRGARPRRAHAVHVDFAQPSQLSDEFSDVHAGAAVHLGWIFPCHHRHPHGVTVSNFCARCEASPIVLMDSPRTRHKSPNSWPLSVPADRLAS